MAKIPQVVLEVAWTTSPRTRPAPEDWTRIDNAGDPVNTIRSMRVSRGLDIKRNTVVAGEGSALLDNRNGALSPGNTASPYSPNVKPRRRIRARVQPVEDGEPERDLFTMFVDRWPIRWHLSDGSVNVEFSDVLALISDDTLPGSVLEYETIQSGPVAYWPMVESTGVTVDDQIGVLDATLTRPMVETDTVTPMDPRPGIIYRAPNTDDPNGQRARVFPFTAATTNYTFAAWVRETGDFLNNTLFSYQPPNPTFFGLYLGLTKLMGEPSMYLVARDGTNFAQVQSAPLPGGFDRAGHWAVFTIDGSTGAVGFWWDGVQIVVSEASFHDDASGIDFATLNSISDTFDMGWGSGVISSTSEYAGVVAHATYWDRLLTVDEIADLHAAGTMAWSGDKTGQRLERILDIVGIDPDDRNVSTGIAVCGPTILAGQNVLDYLRKLAVTEASPLFVDPSGRITFPGRLPNNPEIAATFAGNPDDGVPYRDLVPDFSIDRTQNVAIVPHEGGQPHTARDADSIVEFGTLNPDQGVIETLHRDGGGARSLAASRVIRNKQPKRVIESITVAAVSPDVAPTHVLDLEISNAITIVAAPPGEGAAWSQNSFIESVEHELDFQAWDWTVSFGAAEYVVLPAFSFDTPGQGWDQSVWSEP